MVRLAFREKAGFFDELSRRPGTLERLQTQAGIALIVDGTTDEIGAMTGKLGNIEGVQVKSVLISPQTPPE